VCVCVVFVCKYVLGHSLAFQPLNLRLCFLRHPGFLPPPHVCGVEVTELSTNKQHTLSPRPAADSALTHTGIKDIEPIVHTFNIEARSLYKAGGFNCKGAKP